MPKIVDPKVKFQPRRPDRLRRAALVASAAAASQALKRAIGKS